MQISLVIFFLGCCRNTQPRFQFIVMNRRNTGQYLFSYIYIYVCICTKYAVSLSQQNSNVIKCRFFQLFVLCREVIFPRVKLIFPKGSPSIHVRNINFTFGNINPLQYFATWTLQLRVMQLFHTSGRGCAYRILIYFF